MNKFNRNSGSSAAIQRLKQDYLRLSTDSVPFIMAEPLPTNIFEWHYLIKGPPDSPYKGGYYHGKLVFPKDFPFKPPAIYMITPNGRFGCNTNDFHPDTWNPAWSVSSILTGLLSFMLENTVTMGSIATSLNTKRKLANESGEFNLQSEVFCELFPDTVKEIRESISKKFTNSQNGFSSTVNNPSENANNHDWYMPKFFAAILLGVFALLVKTVILYLETH